MRPSLGQIEARMRTLEAKVKANNPDVTLRCELREESTFEIEHFNSLLDVKEGVTMFVLVFISFLGAED